MTERGRKSMTVAQLVYHYYFNPPPVAPPPLEPVVSDATTQVIPYTDWIKLKCGCCKKVGNVSGIWKCEFAGDPNYVQPLLMCAACAFYDAQRLWSGFFSRKLIRVDLITTLTYPSRTP